MNDIPLPIDDPFGPTLAPGALHIGPTLQQRIDLIEHLLEFGRQMIVLSGPPGSGKSTLLAAIAVAAGERWNCVNVQGGPALQARAMLSQIADALDVDLSADSEPRMALTMLRLRLNVLERAGKLTVLLIDDADQLPPDAVASLVALARSEDQAAEARVLMAADQDHAGLLANLQRDRPQHGLVHVVEIPSLADNQTGDFIAQRLGAVGQTLDNTFSQADVQRIAAAAAGNPARVVTLARQHYASRHAAREGGTPRAGGRRHAIPRAGAARFLPTLGDRRSLLLLLPILAVGAWWALRTPSVIDTPSEPLALELPQATPPGATATTAAAPPPSSAPSAPEAAAAPPDPRLTDNGDQELIEIVLPDEPALPDVAPTPAPPPGLPPPAAPVEPIPLPAAPAVVAGPAPAAPPAPVPAAAPAPAPQPAVPPPPAPKPTPKPAPPPAAAPTAPVAAATPRVTGFSAEWLLKQPRGGYTLQLAGVRDRASATRFIQRHGLNAETTLLTTRRDGLPWYVLVHGYYPTRQAALAAAARLPGAVKKEVQPWARTIGDLAKLPR